MAWQIAFLIGSDPVRFRLLMIPSMIEKFAYVSAVAVLYGRAGISSADAMTAPPDLLLGILFVAAFARTPKSGQWRLSANGKGTAARCGRPAKETI